MGSVEREVSRLRPYRIGKWSWVWGSSGGSVLEGCGRWREVGHWGFVNQRERGFVNQRESLDVF